VAEAQRELEVRAAGLHAVADADDLEGLGVPLGDAGDHVRDERPRQPVQGTALALVVGPLHPQRPVVLTGHGDGGCDGVRQGSLGALDVDRLALDGDVHPGGHGDRKSSDA
jgi:hypothetical protein